MGPTAAPRITAGWKRGQHVRILDGDPEAAHDVGRAGVSRRRDVQPVGPGNRRQAERRAVGRRQLAGDALMAEQVGAVGAHVHDQPRVGQRHGLEQRRAGRGVGGELEDAVVLLSQAELARGAEHALAHDAADRPRLDGESLGAGHARAHRANG